MAIEVKAAEPAGRGERFASGGPSPALAAPNLTKAFLATAERLGPQVAIRDPARGVELTWTELRERTGRIAAGLARLGVDKGDTVALMLSNRWEFIPADLAAVSLGAVPFSIYQTSSPEQIAYLVGDSGARVAIVEGPFIDRFEQARGELPELEHVIGVDAGGAGASFAELEASGAEPVDLDASSEGTGPDDLLTLIYTSGTTGPPKGVQLTHRNLISILSSVDHLLPLPETGARVISWLPAAHIAERAAHYYLPVVKGIEVTICPDPRQIVEVLPEVRPTWFFAVPRIWEKLKAGLEAKLSEEASGVRRRLALWAVDVGLRKVRAEQEAAHRGGGPGVALRAQHALADRLVLSKLRHALGLDEAVAINVGAAPTSIEVLEFFHGLGLPIGELWGMSETCGVVTVNPPGEVKIGTVGPPLSGFEVRIADDGEILVRGDAVMPGYRNQPEKTAEAIDADGWLHTGDIGELDADGYLRIVDRKKELIINAAGKNMSPAAIEGVLKAASPLIGQAVAVGDGRPYNVALITLDPDYAPIWAQQNGIGEANLDRLADSERVVAAIGAAIEHANAKLSRVEQVKKFKVLPVDWHPGGDELTPTMKLKRKPIAVKYADEIEALYEG
ncbi:MAG TPA: long-chain fatty acid--CoA ligase [Solirubrobacterales bacterium]|nr:long-chain fatty acid--CoA ligase [Solirubrobacterales bacterium]